MKTYSISSLYRGIQLTLMVLAKSNADAARIADVSAYHMRQYSGVVKGRHPMLPADAEDESIYAYFDSGELTYAMPDNRRTLFPYSQMKEIIDAHRKECPTYQATLEKYLP